MQKTLELEAGKNTGTKKRRYIPSKGAVLAISAPIFILILYAVFSSSKPLADLAVKYFSAPARHLLGTVFSVLPFSVMEIIYVFFVLGVVIFIVRSVIHISRAKGRRRRLAAKRVFTLVLVFLYIFAGYSALWGIEHSGSSFSEQSGFSSPGVSVGDLIRVAELFLENANASAETVARGESGVFAESLDDIFAAYDTIYDAIEEEFPSLSLKSLPPKRLFLFSKIMSMTGFTGIYFPFSGESNINIDAPAAGIPATIAHELAHQRGVPSEAECNFIGIAASITSGNAAYEYSGWYLGLTYLMNALYKTDTAAWQELRLRFGEELEADWNYSREYWAAYDSAVSTASSTVYDTYLKAHGHSDGIKSYGACVDLLVEYFK